MDMDNFKEISNKIVDVLTTLLSSSFRIPMLSAKNIQNNSILFNDID